jgi:hypothetical protein
VRECGLPGTVYSAALCSHRGGQGFKSPQLHREIAGQRPDMRMRWFAWVRFVRFWERRCPILGADLEATPSVPGRNCLTLTGRRAKDSGTVCACSSEPRIFQTTAPERYDPFVDCAQRHLPTSTVRSGGTRRLYRRCGQGAVPLHMDHDALMPTDDVSQCDRTLRHGHPRNYAYG